MGNLIEMTPKQAAPRKAPRKYLTQVSTVANRVDQAILESFRADVPKSKWKEFENQTARLVKRTENHKGSLWNDGKQLTSVNELFKQRPRFLAYLKQVAHISERSADNYCSLFDAWPVESDYRDAVKVLEANGKHTVKAIYAQAQQVIHKREETEPRTRIPAPVDLLKVAKAFVKRFDPEALPTSDQVREAADPGAELDKAVQLRTDLESAKEIIADALECLIWAEDLDPTETTDEAPSDDTDDDSDEVGIDDSDPDSEDPADTDDDSDDTDDDPDGLDGLDDEEETTATSGIEALDDMNFDNFNFDDEGS